MPTLRFAEDRSDREMERFKKGEMAAQRLCGFSVNERASYRSFCEACRKSFGTRRLEDIFDVMRAAMKEVGPIREEFAFVVSGRLVSKLGVRAGPRSRSRLRRVRQPDYAAGILETLDVDAREGLKGVWREIPQLQAE